MPTPHDAVQPVTQQPVASQKMVVNPKNSLNKPDIEGKGRQWSYDLCSCNKIGTFCLAGCLPCIVYGTQKGRLNHLERNGTPNPERGGVFSSNCLLYGCLGCYGPCVLHPTHRAQVRSRYGIKGGDCTDFWTAWCCSPCALAQEEGEIDLEEKALAQQRDGHKD